MYDWMTNPNNMLINNMTQIACMDNIVFSAIVCIYSWFHEV